MKLCESGEGEMKRPFIFVLLSVFVAGCVSKPAAKVEAVTLVAPDAPLAVGDCLVLKPGHDALQNDGWRETIGADGYFPAPLGQRVKIVGKTLTEARDLINSEYVRLNVFRRSPGLVLLRCEEYDRKKREIELRIKQTKKVKA